MLPAAVDDSCGDVINDAAQTYDEFDNEFYSDEQFDGASSWDAVSTHWTESEPDCAFMSDPCSTPPASVMPKQLMFDSPAPDLLLKSKAWRLGRAGRASVIHACEKQERQHGHEQQHIMKPTKHELLAQSKAWRLAQASAALVRETSNSNSVTSASNMDVISAADQRAVLLAKSKEWRHARALASGMSSNSDAAVPEHGLKQQEMEELAKAFRDISDRDNSRLARFCSVDALTMAVENAHQIGSTDMTRLLLGCTTQLSRLYMSRFCKQYFIRLFYLPI